MSVASIIAVHSDLSSASSKNSTFAGLDLVGPVDITLGEPILVLLGGVDVLLQVFRSCTKLDARRIVELGPLVLPTLHQLVEDNAGDSAVGHTVARVTSGDVDVLVAARILSNVGHVVDGLHHLARPPVVDAFDHRETLASPLLESNESFVGTGGLSGLMVLAADDQ